MHGLVAGIRDATNAQRIRPGNSQYLVDVQNADGATTRPRSMADARRGAAQGNTTSRNVTGSSSSIRTLRRTTVPSGARTVTENSAPCGMLQTA